MENTIKHHKHRPRSKFSGKIGYVMSVAASAVGLGNIWRFPYLAAKYGGGMFLITYLLLTITFGYVMIVSETALGRLTKKSPVGAFASFGNTKTLKVGGWLNAVVPMVVVSYYCVIGGWVIKYLFEYLCGHFETIATDTYFSNLIASSASVEFWFIVFGAIVFFVVLSGVKNGVERVSKIMMPILIVLAVAIAVYSITRPGALEGVKYFLIPNFENFSIMTVVAAMGQMFYSLSIAMGILYTYGSYIGNDVDIEKSTAQVEFFDTGVAILAGLMIIPAVFAFSGGDMNALQAGPSLTFITLPKVFESMELGGVVGIAFFVMFFFAALTSAISLLETSVSTFEDELGWHRPKACALMAVIIFVIGTACSLGYGVWEDVKILKMTFLDFFDFLANSIMIPIAALATCYLILRVAGIEKVENEVRLSSDFKRQKMYRFFIKYLAPAFITIILLTSIADVFGWISI